MSALCTDCGGRGSVNVPLANAGGIHVAVCSSCAGTGRRITSPPPTAHQTTTQGGTSSPNIAAPMLILAFAAVLFLGAIWLYYQSGSPKTSSTNSANGNFRGFTVRNASGGVVYLQPSEFLVVVRMGTWCPASAKFRDEAKKLLRSTAGRSVRFAYVFCDETEHAMQAPDDIKLPPGWDQDVARLLEAERNKKQKYPVTLANEKFLSDCGADIYFEHPDHPLPGTQFPQLLNADGTAAAKDTAFTWLQSRFK